MPSSKKDKKNGKNSGGVVAAVTELGANRFSVDNSSKSALSTSPSSPPVDSPEIKAVTPSSNGNPTASPLLDAVSTSTFATSIAPSTHEWTKHVATMSGSPGNLISLMGESPPTQPSSYEDPRAMPYGWSSPRPSVGYHPPSASPPTSHRRPLSFQLDGPYPPSEMYPQSAVAAARRSSMHSHFAQARASPGNPPLPHQPQPHFYGTPDIDFDLQPQTGMKAGSKGYHFGFDTLPTPVSEYGTVKNRVLLAGYEGGLEVYSVSKRGLERLASLKGLRGGVHHAKILPWTASGDASDVFPLVAVVVHGPALPPPLPPTPEINVEGDYDAVSSDRSEALSNGAGHSDTQQRDAAASKTPPILESYQTSVEVYSLKTSKLVSVLLEAPKVPLKLPVSNPLFKAPPPTGALHIKADEGNIVVSSGATGECWIYRHTVLPPAAGARPTQAVQFVCLGKLWTTVQQPLKGENAPDNDRGRPQGVPQPPPRQRPQSAIVSLSGRWIAFCPAAPSSQIALRAVVPVPRAGRVPGLMTLTPPQLPPVNTELDMPDAESIMNKLMRDATQELIQGAKWVGKQGWQAWNNYWNPQAPQPSRSPPVDGRPWGQEAAQFPPTHGGASSPSVAKDPGLISIVDIEALGNSVNLHPIATFPIPNGCSFLSFTPNGLSLFTASSKGDVQTVWDLLRIQHTKASPLQPTNTPTFPSGPRVRQIAQFSRMTVARIIDVAWTKPSGERAAMVTERGTVHLLDMPASAFVWPPPRRRTRVEETKAASAETGPTSAMSIATSALTTVRDAARPLIARPRRSSSNVPQLTGASIVDHASQGGKVIAGAISHSLGKTGTAINHLRHTGENRVSLPSAMTVPGPACVTWIANRKDHYLFTLGDGLVRTFPNKIRRSREGRESTVRAPRLSRYKDFKVPNLPEDAIATSIKKLIDPDEYLDFSDKDNEGANAAALNGRPRQPIYANSSESSIPQAEIESSAPYQPFHTDRRVALYIYSTNSTALAAAPLPSISTLLSATHLGESPASNAPTTSRKKKKSQNELFQQEQLLLPATSSPEVSPGPSPNLKPSGAWAFGQVIPATKLDLGLLPLSEEESFHIPSDQTRALPVSAMERVLQHVGDDDTHLVVTTRRRRGAGHGGGAADLDDDGFFEDDCEVLDFADQRV